MPVFKNKLQWYRFVKILISWLGTPYGHFQFEKGKGADCGLFIAACLKEFGVLKSITFDYAPRFWHMVGQTEVLLNHVFDYIKNHGGADYVLHLAGYYDFTQKKNPAYEQVNVIATRYLLELSNMLKVKRFIFSSSVAACKFPPKGKAITEESPADGDFPYACSKRRGELLIKEYSES